MNMTKILCKYCSENDEHTKVTIGSIIHCGLKVISEIGIIVVILFFAFFLTLLAVNVDAKTLTEAIHSVAIAWAIVGIIILFAFIVCYLYMKSHEIEIAKCERRD